MSRLLATASIALLLLTAVPSHATERGGTTVATDPCDAGFSVSEGASPDYEDLCEVRYTTVAAGPGTPTTLAVTLVGVGDLTDRTPMTYSTAWVAGDCGFIASHRDATPTRAAVDELWVGCGEVTRTCTVDVLGNEADCTSNSETETVVALDPAVVDGKTLTFTVTFDGELEEWADRHAEGAALRPATTIAGAGLDPVLTYGLYLATCGTDTPCSDVVGDLVYGDGAYTVG